MTEKQKRFCDEYLLDLNATRAYKAAYPKIKSDAAATVNGSRLLAKANIRDYIDERLKEMEDEKIADAKEVMKYLTSVMRGESESEIVVVEGCGDGNSKARKLNKTPDEKERLKAAELLSKRYGLNVCKVEVSDETERAKKLDAITDILGQMKSEDGD